MNASKAKSLLQQAEAEPDFIERNLLVAAALREVLTPEPIVVGGLAQDYYTESYNPTDLDLCAEVDGAAKEILSSLGFQREPPRHWYHTGVGVAVEFPETELAGDKARVKDVQVGNGVARVIGVEDLYLDRVKQATMTEREGDINFQSAIAIAAANLKSIDWDFVRRRIKETQSVEPQTGAAMRSIDRRVRRKVRDALVRRKNV